MSVIVFCIGEDYNDLLRHHEGKDSAGNEGGLMTRAHRLGYMWMAYYVIQKSKDL
jgi:hypothetical protein